MRFTVRQMLAMTVMLALLIHPAHLLYRLFNGHADLGRSFMDSLSSVATLLSEAERAATTSLVESPAQSITMLVVSCVLMAVIIQLLWAFMIEIVVPWAWPPPKPRPADHHSLFRERGQVS